MKPTDLEQVRADFAEKLREIAGLRSPSLVRALATVPREAFVGPGPWKILRLPDLPSGWAGRRWAGHGGHPRYQLTPDDDPRHLYDMVLVALDANRTLNNGEPASLSRWLDSLDLGPGDRFLHIGCGVGYYTAIAAEMVLPRGGVVGVEVDPQLAERAKRNLSARTDEGDDLLAQAYRRGTHESVRSLRRDQHAEGPECWLHAPRFCLSSVA